MTIKLSIKFIFLIIKNKHIRILLKFFINIKYGKDKKKFNYFKSKKIVQEHLTNILKNKNNIDSILDNLNNSDSEENNDNELDFNNNKLDFNNFENYNEKEKE